MKIGSKFSLLIVIITSIFVLGCGSKENHKTILLYCAAGIKPVIEQVAKEYQKEFGIAIEVQYGGSGTLLSNIRVAKQGDLYIAGDKSYIDEADNYGLIEETQALAFIKPVIAVSKGNPKNILGVTDLLREDVKFTIANPDAASVGRLTKKMLKKSGQWSAIEKQVFVLMPTVNEVANTIKLKSSDAGIIWDATANQYSELEIVSVPEFNSFIKNITIAVLKTSKHPTEALHFLRYLSASDKGEEVFKALGYKPIQGDAWEKEPRLLFYSGGVNRVAIDQTINEFENREGVKVDRVYNGCGILVSQIKAGQRPDAYLSCDASFMTQVTDKFKDITDISTTEIVIAVAKGNPKKIHSLSDLEREKLKIGICNHNQSALGSLTKKLLEGENLWDGVYKNVRSQTPTADLLVNQLRTGSLDAVVVYKANVAKVLDKVGVVSLSKKEAMALQNFGISNNSKHQFLVKRLLQKITSSSSKQQYLQNGFNWEYEAIKN